MKSISVQHHKRRLCRTAYGIRRD